MSGVRTSSEAARRWERSGGRDVGDARDDCVGVGQKHGSSELPDRDRWGPTEQEVLARKQAALDCLSENDFDAEGLSTIGEFPARDPSGDPFATPDRCERGLDEGS